MGIFYPNGPTTGAHPSFAGSPTGSSISFIGVAVAHAAILALLLFATPAERLAEFVRPLAVRLIELAPPAAQPPSPSPPQPKPRPPPRAPIVQPRILAVATPAPEAPAAFVVPPPPPPAPVETAVPPAPTFVAAPPAPITAARFDADYLHNPKPVYPAISRRLGEAGKVVMRVHVEASGLASEIAIKTSSRFPRLDNAALEAVRQWRFVPARRGGEPVDAWVLVPIVFNLEG